MDQTFVECTRKEAEYSAKRRLIVQGDIEPVPLTFP